MNSVHFDDGPVDHCFVANDDASDDAYSFDGSDNRTATMSTTTAQTHIHRESVIIIHICVHKLRCASPGLSCQ